MSDAEHYAQQIGEWRRMLTGLVRRMAIKLTSGGVWQLAGHVLFGSTRETREVELWPGIGFFARPPKGSESAEAIELNVGGQNNPAIVATRDEATRQKVDDVDYDEAAVFNTEARVHVTKDGEIHARTHDGEAVALATKDDLDVLRAAINGAVIAIGAGGAAAIVTAADVALAARLPPSGPWPNGTSKLKGE